MPDKVINKPTKIDDLLSKKIVGVSCGLAHSFFLDTDGMAHACGWNKNGQLGKGKLDSELRKPYEIYLGEKINFISCGGVHSLLISEEKGNIFATGSNSCG